MKKLIILALSVFAFGFIANGQVKPGNSTAVYGANNEITYSQEQLAWIAQYDELLSRQNRLLNTRKTALIISVCGAGVTGIGVAVANAERFGSTKSIGSVIAEIGGFALATGGVWYLVNEFVMIGNQKKINEHLLLKYSPNGVALSF